MKKKGFTPLKFLLGFIILIILFFFWIQIEPVNKDPNIYYFDGKITRIFRSNNHSFGIYVIKLDTVHVTVLDSNYFLPNKNHYPVFRYKGNLGEVYTTLSLDDSVGYRIKSNIADSSIEVINNKGQIVSTASTFPVTELPDIRFIEKHSMIK